MADINIPGVSDKYKTKDLVAGLMEAEKIPLKREQDRLDGYKAEQQNWRRVNQYMTSLRDSARTLYSFNNPFNEKTASSSNEAAVTAEAGRDAQLQPFKVQVQKIASADRFLSRDLPKNYVVPAGTYTFASGEKSASVTWRGGPLADFVNALNKRSNNVVKASLISPDGNSRTLLLEAVNTGEKNALVFKGDALAFALDSGLIQKSQKMIGSPLPVPSPGGTILVAPQSDAFVPVPAAEKKEGASLSFSLSILSVPEDQQNSAAAGSPVLPQGGVSYKGVAVQNAASDPSLPPQAPAELPVPVQTDAVLFVKNSDGTSVAIRPESADTAGEINLKFADYPLMSGIEVKNTNTAREVQLSHFQVISQGASRGYEPVNPVDVASDAQFTYEGIKMTRPANKIDDAVPFITLNLHGTTTQPATITIERDVAAAKDAIISFVGNYNQLLAEINILTQSKPEVVAELEYLSETDREAAMKRLGSLQADFTLNNGKQNLQRALTAPYVAVDSAAVKLLADLGIASKTAAGGGVNAAQLRGYLEIDEKKLDAALANSLEDIKDLFGFDANGDMVIDNGLAFQVEKQLQSYTQIGGVIASRSSGLDSKIRSSETQIKRLETQVAAKEAELKRKYGQMESTLNNLNAQSASINNFSAQNGGQKN